MPQSVSVKQIAPVEGQEKAHGVYSPWILYFYDWVVLSFTNTLAWKCSTPKDLMPLFRSTMGESHLDIGVGTGYFPAKAIELGSPCQEITLVDLNSSSLAAAQDRIARVPSPDLKINALVANAMEPLPLPPAKKFDSISMFYLIHCIPGPAERKNKVFDVARGHLAPDGVLAGVTVLGSSRPMNWLAWTLMTLYNRYGIFGNWDDDEETFKMGLYKNFEEIETWVVGRSMFFRARKPRL